jgi:hypothetical protein
MLEKTAANTPSQVDALRLERISGLVSLDKDPSVVASFSNNSGDGASIAVDSKFGGDGLKITKFLTLKAQLSQILQIHG